MALVVAAMAFVASLSVAQPLAVLLERLNSPLPTDRESALQGISAVGQLDMDLARIVAERLLDADQAVRVAAAYAFRVPPHGAPETIPYVIPTVVRDVPPRYPSKAMNSGTQGNVRIRCLVGAGGTVERILILDGPEILREAATDAVKKWRFTPARFRGLAVPGVVTVDVAFTLKRGTHATHP